MWPSRYLCLFFIYSLLGWIYESAYCTIKTGKWENRGFLYGPVCPIYGWGAGSISLIADLLPPLASADFRLEILRIFLVAFFGSIVLEYSTSWLLEKLFHATWWDYNDMPFNLNGRVSLFSTLGFGIAGPVVVYGIAPPVSGAVTALSGITLELFALLALAVGVCDMTLTVSALTDFEKQVMSMEGRFNDRMDELVENVQTTMGKAKTAALKRVKSFRYPWMPKEPLARVQDKLRK